MPVRLKINGEMNIRKIVLRVLDYVLPVVRPQKVA